MDLSHRATSGDQLGTGPAGEARPSVRKAREDDEPSGADRPGAVVRRCVNSRCARPRGAAGPITAADSATHRGSHAQVSGHGLRGNREDIRLFDPMHQVSSVPSVHDAPRRTNALRSKSDAANTDLERKKSMNKTQLSVLLALASAANGLAQMTVSRQVP